jgi:hypothetical protein
MQRLEFASREWVDMLRDELLAGLRDQDLDGVEFILSEEYTDPPSHLLDSPRTTIGWYLEIRDGKASVHCVPRDDATIKVTGDYASLLPLAREVHVDGAPTPAVQKRLAELLAEGRVHIAGDHTNVPEAFARVHLHDRLAARTA